MEEEGFFDTLDYVLSGADGTVVLDDLFSKVVFIDHGFKLKIISKTAIHIILLLKGHK